VRRAHEYRVDRALEPLIVAELPLARDEAQIFLARNGRANTGLPGGHHSIHFGMLGKQWRRQ